MTKKEKTKSGKKEKKIVKKERKTKKTKDKDAPKRATSAFFYYLQHRRPILKGEQPSLGNQDIVSKMSEEWKEMKDSEKAPFQKLANTDKERYAKAKEEYAKKGGAGKTSAAKGKKSVDKKKKEEESEGDEDGSDEEEDEEEGSS
jgi:hypothetical protein